MKLDDLLDSLRDANPVPLEGEKRWSELHADGVRRRVLEDVSSGTLPMTPTSVSQRRRLSPLALAGAAACVAALLVGGVLLLMVRGGDNPREEVATSGPDAAGQEDGGAAPSSTPPSIRADAQAPAEPLPEDEWNALAAEVGERAATSPDTVLGTWVSGNRFLIAASAGSAVEVEALYADLVPGRVTVTECPFSREDLEEASSETVDRSEVLGTSFTIGFDPSRCAVAVSVSSSVVAANLASFSDSVSAIGPVPVQVTVADGEYSRLPKR